MSDDGMVEPHSSINYNEPEHAGLLATCEGVRGISDSLVTGT